MGDKGLPDHKTPPNHWYRKLALVLQCIWASLWFHCTVLDLCGGENTVSTNSFCTTVCSAHTSRGKITGFLWFSISSTWYNILCIRSSKEILPYLLPSQTIEDPEKNGKSQGKRHDFVHNGHHIEHSVYICKVMRHPKYLSIEQRWGYRNRVDAWYFTVAIYLCE